MSKYITLNGVKFASFGITGPCLDCEERHPGCHSECEKYLEYRKKLDEARAKYQKQRETENNYYEARFGKRKKET